MNTQQRARAEFEKLTRDEVADAIRGMAREGFSDHSIAAATGLAVEQVRRIIGERIQ